METAGHCYLAGIHAANHALLAVTPLFLKCDPGDIGTEHAFAGQVITYPPPNNKKGPSIDPPTFSTNRLIQ